MFIASVFLVFDYFTFKFIPFNFSSPLLFGLWLVECFSLACFSDVTKESLCDSERVPFYKHPPMVEIERVKMTSKSSKLNQTTF